MLPFIRGYAGCKKDELNRLQSLFDDSKIIVDVFGGSGAVCLSLIDQEKTIIYNDLNPILTTILTCITDKEKALSLEGDLMKKYPRSAEEIKIVRDQNDVMEFLGKITFGFRGTSLMDKRRWKAWENRHINFKIVEQSETFHKVNKSDFSISNMHFKDLMESFKDNPDACLYLDPPYLETLKYTINNTEIDFNIDDVNYLIEFMKTAKCRVILHIDYNAHCRESLNDYVHSVYPINLKMRKMSKKKYPKYHIIYKNYKTKSDASRAVRI